MGSVQSLIAPTVDLTPYECPICHEFMVPPYFQCKNGHVICNFCLEKVQNCPICKAEKPYIRNRMLENIVKPLLFSCEFPGCEEKFFKQELHAEHIKECDSKPNPVSCQFEGCKWVEHIVQLIPHMIAEHSIPVVREGQFTRFFYPMSSYGNLSNINIYSRYNRNFIITLTRRSWDFWTRCYFIVQIVGTQKEAKKFTCSASISDNDTKVMLESTVSSILEGREEIIYNDQCFSFSTKQAMKLAKDGNLEISLTIQQK